MTDARTIYILSQIQPKWIIGFQKQKFQIYSDSINEDYNQVHTSEKMRAILQKLGVQNINLQYCIQTQSQSEFLYQQIQKKYSLQKYIVLNLFAGARFRSFLPETGQRIIQTIRQQNIQIPIVIVGPPSKADEIQQLIQALPNQNLYFLPELKKISDLAELIRHAILVITPDTSIVHIASAFDIPIICVYCKDSDSTEKNSMQWSPKSSFSKLIIATGRTDGEVDVNTYQEDDMSQALRLVQATHLL